MKMKPVRLAVVFALFTTVPGGGAESASEAPGCGEACVRVLCEYYDIGYVPYVVLGHLRPGAFKETSLKQIRDCLSELGMECSIVRGSRELLDRVDKPMVLYLEPPVKDDIGHFGVVRRLPETGRLIAYDPLMSPDPIYVDENMLRESWSGVALVVHVRCPRFLYQGL